MRRKQIRLAIITVVFLCSCSDIGSDSSPVNDVAKRGNVAFALAKNTIPPEVGILEVLLERNGYDPITRTVEIGNFIDTVRIAINNIPAGEWQLTIDAKDSSGHLRYKGSSAVAIFENQTVQVFVQMQPAEGGIGGVAIFVTWPSDESSLRIRTTADTMHFVDYIPLTLVNQSQTEVMLATCCIGPDWRLQENLGSGEWSPPGECEMLCVTIPVTLAPGSVITDSVRVLKSGHYRVMLRYMILSPISSKRPAWLEAYSNEFWVVKAIR